MGITATIMSATTGQPIQTMTFGRMPRQYATFNLHSGELIEIQRIEVGKPKPGKMVAPVSIWVRPKA